MPFSSPPSRRWAIIVRAAGMLLAGGLVAYIYSFATAHLSAVIGGMTLVALLLGVTFAAAGQLTRWTEFQQQVEEEFLSLSARLRQLLSLIPADESPEKWLTFGEQSEPIGPALVGQMTTACVTGRGLLIQLRSQQAQAISVLANFDSGVLVLNPVGRITLANNTFKRYFSITIDPVGNLLEDVVRQPQLTEVIESVAADQSPREVILDLRGQDDVRRVLRARCAAVSFEMETVLIVTVYDETENHLIQEMRREFIANVSHELKTPLAAIKGFAETVEIAIHDDPEAACHFLSQIQDQCRRLERLIADMMTLARAQSGRQHLHLATVNLDAVLAESIATYAPIAASKQIELRQEPLDGAVPLIYADREATLTIANNVIGNAIRYTPEGGSVVASIGRDGGFVVLTVRDTGIGIPRQEQQRIFERFYRADNSRKHLSSGTGLGLAIVKNLSQAQGGQVKLDSRPGQGSTFRIYLPDLATAYRR